MCIPDWGGVVYQVKKRRARTKDIQKHPGRRPFLLLGARFAMCVDTDINIYSADDLLWPWRPESMRRRHHGRRPGGMGQTFQPAERSSAGEKDWTQSNIRFSGAIGVDATVPYQYRDAFLRASYPIERFN